METNLNGWSRCLHVGVCVGFDRDGLAKGMLSGVCVSNVWLQMCVRLCRCFELLCGELVTFEKTGGVEVKSHRCSGVETSLISQGFAVAVLRPGT